MMRLACAVRLQGFISKETSLYIKQCLSPVEPQVSMFSKRLFGVSALCNTSGKPVILSASDVVKDEASTLGIPITDTPLLAELAEKGIDPPFVDIGLATGWWPSQFVEGWLESFYTATGCPWWATIAFGTFALRVVTLPLFIASRKALINYTNHSSEVTKLRERWMESVRGKDVAARMKSHTAYKDYVKKHNVGSFRMLLLNCFQPFLFISCMRALSAISAVPLPSLEASSFLWISNLACPDPYRLLPIIAGSVIGMNMIAVVKLNATLSVSPAMKKYIGYFALLPPIVMPLLFGSWPSAIGIYIVVNTCFTTSVTIALQSTTIKEKLNMPEPIQTQGSSGIVGGYFRDAFKTSKEKAQKKVEMKAIEKMLKEEKKARKKALKGDPPVLYKIGKEATLKEEVIPDFQRDWRPKRVNIYDR